MFWRKHKEIEALVLEHLGHVDATLQAFSRSLDAYLRQGDVETADRYALETHQAEGRADDARRRIETQLLSGSLLPTSRRDILEIIEQVDRLANAAEEILDYLLLQRVEVPDEIMPQITEIGVQSNNAFDEVKKAVTSLFQNVDQALEHTKLIEQLEGEVDHLERRATKRLFALDIELARKLQISGFIQRLVRLSDRAEDLSDLIELVVAARRV
jgi:predicted phosphate transport protein (TIGR00153 family)